jgi:O-antigen/teichoic acid export membrane protein
MDTTPLPPPPAPAPTGGEGLPLAGQPAPAAGSSRAQRVWAVLLFLAACVCVGFDAVMWFFAGWASVDGDVGVPATPAATDKVEVCGILVLLAAVAAVAAPVSAFVVTLRRRRGAAGAACWVAGLSLAISVVACAVAASVMQNPGN